MPGTSADQKDKGAGVITPDNVTAVCPTEEVLQVGSQTNVICPVTGCARTFAQPSARHFHMVKVHKIIETDQDVSIEHHVSSSKTAAGAGELRYYCPVDRCKYTLRQGRYFTSMKNLNQHYRTVHAEKKFKCSRCGFGFGELRRQLRHEKTCGLKFLCKQCGNIYNNKDALQTHCSRSGHRSGFSSINSQVFNEAGEERHISIVNVLTPRPVSPVPIGRRIEVGSTSSISSSTVSAVTPAMTVSRPPPPTQVTPVPPPSPQVRRAATTSHDAEGPALQGPQQQLGNADRNISQPEKPETLMKASPCEPSNSKVPYVTGSLEKDDSTLKHTAPSSNTLQSDPTPTLQPEQPIPLHQPQQHPEPPISKEQPTLPVIHSPMSNCSLSGVSSSSKNPVGDSTIILNAASTMAQKAPTTSPSKPCLTTSVAMPYILPKPDALYMPIQLQVNPLNQSLFAGPAGPVVLIINNSKYMEAPRRPVRQVLTPKLTPRDTPIHATGTPLHRNPVAKEIEVQTDTEHGVQHSVVSTNELSVQTVFSHSFPGVRQNDDPLWNERNFSAAETQTVEPPRFSVQTSTKSSQVSPSKQMRDCATEPISTNRSIPSKSAKPRRRKNTDSSVTQQGSLETFAKKRRRRGKKTSTNGVQMTSCDAFVTNRMVSAAVGTGPLEPQLESIGVGTMSSPLTLEELALVSENLKLNIPAPVQQRETVSVSTDMTRENISVGTMPSPPIVASTSFNPVTMNTIGTDPLPDFTGDNLSSVFSSQETQTSFWAELQASVGESNATQTMESYLAATSISSDPLNLPSLMESGVQTCHAQNSQTQTWSAEVDPLQQRSVGVGTSFLTNSHSSLFEGMETEGLSRSIGIDTQLFDDLFPEVSSRSVAISTPLLDNSSTSQAVGEGSAVLEQRSVGVSPEQHGVLMPELDVLSRSNESQAVSCQTASEQSESQSAGSILQYESIATASVQTDTDFELPVFLAASSQTSNFDPALANMETQTVDMFNQLLSNMETQTSSTILAELNLADIETQTPTPVLPITQSLTSVETQTLPSTAAEQASSRTSMEISATSIEASASSSRMAVFIDTETQTLLPNLHLTESSLTDSHTQTTVGQFASLVDELEKT